MHWRTSKWFEERSGLQRGHVGRIRATWHIAWPWRMGRASLLARDIDWPASGESSGCHDNQIDKVNQLSVRIPSNEEQASLAILILYCVFLTAFSGSLVTTACARSWSCWWWGGLRWHNTRTKFCKDRWALWEVKIRNSDQRRGHPQTK